MLVARAAAGVPPPAEPTADELVVLRAISPLVQERVTVLSDAVTMTRFLFVPAPKVLETIDRVAEARMKRVPTGELNRFIQAVTAEHPPASPGRRRVRILYATQRGVAPPAFVLFTNVATEFHFSYERYLVNRIREEFGFIGTRIRLQVRRREKSNP